MARQELTITTFSTNGAAIIAPQSVLVADGAMVVNTGAVKFHVYNPHAVTSANITFVTGATVEGFAVADQTTAVAALATKWFGPYTPATFNQTGDDDGKIHIDVANTPLDIVAFTG